MKKFFLLLVAACLLCCVSCKDNNQPAPENKKVTAYDKAMKIIDKAEKDLKQSKNCADLEKIDNYIKKEFDKLGKKYDEKDLTKKEQKKLVNRLKSLGNLYLSKQKEFGCGYNEDNDEINDEPPVQLYNEDYDNYNATDDLYEYHD